MRETVKLPAARKRCIALLLAVAARTRTERGGFSGRVWLESQ